MNLMVLNPEACPVSYRSVSLRLELNGLGLSSFFLPFCPRFFPCFHPVDLCTIALAIALSLEVGSWRGNRNNREGWAELRC